MCVAWFINHPPPPHPHLNPYTWAAYLPTYVHWYTQGLLYIISILVLLFLFFLVLTLSVLYIHGRMNYKDTEGCGAAQSGCGAAQLVVRRLAVRQARVRISARHPMEAPLTERRRDEDSRNGPRRLVKDERSVIVLYEWMLKTNKFQKECHSATKPLWRHRTLYVGFSLKLTC